MTFHNYYYSYFFFGTVSSLNEVECYEIEFPIPLGMQLKTTNEENKFELFISINLSWKLSELPLPDITYNLLKLENKNLFLQIKNEFRLYPIKVSLILQGNEFHNYGILSSRNLLLVIEYSKWRKADFLKIETNFNTANQKSKYIELKQKEA